MADICRYIVMISADITRPGVPRLRFYACLQIPLPIHLFVSFVHMCPLSLPSLVYSGRPSGSGL